MASDSPDTISISTAIESLVGDAVPGPHVVVLVPDVSVTLGIRDVRLMVVPLVRKLQLISKLVLQILTAQTSNSPPVVGLKNMASGPLPVS